VTSDIEFSDPTKIALMECLGDDEQINIEMPYHFWVSMIRPGFSDLVHIYASMEEKLKLHYHVSEGIDVTFLVGKVVYSDTD
jgi:hypothetical protein